MRNLILLFVISLFFNNLIAQQYVMTKPEGFGAGTTGGGSVAPITVSTESALQAALISTGPKVILVSGTITFSGLMSVKVTDKTLLGLPGAKLVNNVQTQAGSGILYLKDGSNNVIIRNLKFEGPGAYDVDGNDNFCADGCTKLWIDHCDFQDGMDGNMDLKGKTDNATISWCKYGYLKPAKAGGSGGANDHRFSGLVGSSASASAAPADGHFSITFQNCYWSEGCKERMPRARNAELHILNCYYNTSVPNALALGLGGGANNLTCYVEKSDFTNIDRTFSSYVSSDGGTIAVTFSECLQGATNVGSVTKPSYTTSAFPVASVSTAIPNTKCGAGATLNISANGAITSNCTVTGFEKNYVTEISTQVYPNPSNGSFSVKGKEDIRSLTINDLNGKTVISKNDIMAGFDTEINSALEVGVYVIKIQNNSGSTETIKFVKSK
ncbi:MAG: T9SS type A sorting domain-containing protein [Opitutaceae bacterium]|nr:T9SS type A sorting domain-containing protein [Cytophagales bacterium]